VAFTNIGPTTNILEQMALRGTSIPCGHGGKTYTFHAFSILSRFRPPISTCKPPPRKSLILLNAALSKVTRITENRERKRGNFGQKWQRIPDFDSRKVTRQTP
jgi:hypothetical protein